MYVRFSYSLALNVSQLAHLAHLSLGDQNLSKQPGAAVNPRAPKECMICFFPWQKMSRSSTKKGLRRDAHTPELSP